MSNAIEVNAWCEVSEVGLKMSREPSFDEWYQTGEGLRVMRTSIPFLLGDWVNLGQGVFGERWSQATDIFGEYGYNTAANYASVCRRVALSDRDPELSYSHHQAVAKLEPSEQRRWLKIAKYDPDEGRALTAAELRAKLRGESEPDLTVEQELLKRAKSVKDRLSDMLAIAEDHSMRQHITALVNAAAHVDDLITILKEVVDHQQAFGVDWQTNDAPAIEVKNL